MPRFTLTNDERRLLGEALVNYAQGNNLNGGDALVAAAATTMAELTAVSTQYLTALRARKVAALNAVPAQATAATNLLTAEIAAIDSALTKV